MSPRELADTLAANLADADADLTRAWGMEPTPIYDAVAARLAAERARRERPTLTVVRTCGDCERTTPRRKSARRLAALNASPVLQAVTENV